jgi:hypothetical protein
LRASEPASELVKSYRFFAMRAAVNEHLTKRAFNLMRSAGIEPILIKGWAIARLYPESGMRPYGDIDLAVSAGQYAEALNLRNSPEGKRYPIDVHRGTRKVDDLSFDELLTRSELVKLGEEDVRIPCPEDHLRILCLHLLRHGAYRPLWLCDIAVAVESRPQGFDWDRCLGSNSRRADSIACTIGLASQLLGADVEGTPVAKRAKKLPSWLVPAVLKQWESPGPPTRYYAPMKAYLKNPSGLLKAFRDRWPNSIEATTSVNGPFNEMPRFPFQLANCVLRTAEFFRDMPRLLRESV